MALSKSVVSDYYKPKGRCDHSTAVIGNKLYNWGGNQDGLPMVHSSEEKRKFLSNIDVLHLETGIWHNKPTTGDPHPGVCGYACTAIENKRKLLFFGGYCGHRGCHYNNISQLDPDTLIWSNIAGDHQRDGPMKKLHCGIMPFTSEGEDHLFITGGSGTPPNNPQPNAEYHKPYYSNRVRTNEQHIYNISTGQYVTPVISGQPPPPCDSFTFNKVTDNSGILYGGKTPDGDSNIVYITKLTKNTVHWERVALKHGDQWPKARWGHAATIINNVLHQRPPVLVIIGGFCISDCWIMDIEKRSWSELTLPISVTNRWFHSLSAYVVSPDCVLLVVLGGKIQFSTLADTTIVALVLKDGQWTVGDVLEDVSSTDVYQTLLHQRRHTEWDVTYITLIQQLQLEKDCVQQEKDRMQQERDRFKKEKDQIQVEKEQETEQIRQKKDTLQHQRDSVLRENSHLQQEKNRITQYNEQLQREKEQIQQEKDQLQRERDHFKRENEQIQVEKKRGRKVVTEEEIQDDILDKEPKIFDICNCLAEHKDKWRSIGEGLDIQHGDLATIRKDILDDGERLSEMLRKWKDSQCSLFTWRNLIDVLKAPAINLNRTANDICYRLLEGDLHEKYKNK